MQANPQAVTALATVTAARDRLAGATDTFAGDAPQAIQDLRAAVTAAQAEQAAWQQAEAARIAAEQARESSNGRSGGSSGGGGSAGGSSGGSAIDRTGGLLVLVNDARAQAGVGPLSYSSSLAGTPCAQSQWMSDTGNFAHGATSGWSGENIAFGFSSTSSVFGAWMNSEGHRANILRAGFTRMGACQVGTYWTQQFC